MLEAIITQKGEYSYECMIDKSDILNFSYTNTNWNQGYLQTIYQAKQDNQLSFKLDLPFKLQEIEFEINSNNYKDRKDVGVELLVSFDGKSYISLGKKKEKINQESNFWSFKGFKNKKMKRLFYKIKLDKNDSYIGLAWIKLKLTGSSKNPLWDIADESIEIQNESKMNLTLESYRFLKQPSIFTDAAHLNYMANNKVAEEMAEYIISNSF